MPDLKVLRFENTFFASNSYIIYKENHSSVWLIDCGDINPIIDWCRTNRKDIMGVFLTHTHFDHIYGLNELLYYYPQIGVYTSSNGALSLSSSRYNLSLFHENEFVYNGNSIILKEGDKVRLYSDVCLNVYETQGHDWSCLSFIVGDYFFTGDSYIPNVKLVTNFPKSDKEKAIKSLEKIFVLMGVCSYLCPGHSDVIMLER